MWSHSVQSALCFCMCSILSGLKHPHIVAFHDSFMHGGEQHVCIIQVSLDGLIQSLSPNNCNTNTNSEPCLLLM